MGVFRSTWRLFGETASLRLIPAASVVLIDSTFTGVLLLLGLARTAHHVIRAEAWSAEQASDAPLSPVSTLALILAIVLQFTLLLSIPQETPWWPMENDWRHYFNFAYPEPIYRPLLLAPIWGRWAVLAAAGVGRSAPGADPRVDLVGRAMRLGGWLRASLLPITLTTIYCSRADARAIGIVISLMVWIGVYLAAWVTAHRTGGQTRASLLGLGLIGQLLFLAVYRAFGTILHR